MQQMLRGGQAHTTYQRNGSAKIIDGHRISSILLTVDLQRGLELNVGVNKFFEGQDGMNTQYWQSYSMENIIKYSGGMKYLPIIASVDGRRRKSVLHISTAMPTMSDFALSLAFLSDTAQEEEKCCCMHDVCRTNSPGRHCENSQLHDQHAIPHSDQFTSTHLIITIIILCLLSFVGSRSCSACLSIPSLEERHSYSAPAGSVPEEGYRYHNGSELRQFSLSRGVQGRSDSTHLA